MGFAIEFIPPSLPSFFRAKTEAKKVLALMFPLIANDGAIKRNFKALRNVLPRLCHHFLRADYSGSEVCPMILDDCLIAFDKSLESNANI